MRRKTTDKLYIGVHAGGIVYCDRTRERHGDYVRLAFLPYDTLVLEIEGSCPSDLRARIEASAAGIIARRGEQFQVSTSGHTVRLGGAK